MLLDLKNNNAKMTSIPKLLWKFNAIPIETTFFRDLE